MANKFEMVGKLKIANSTKVPSFEEKNVGEDGKLITLRMNTTSCGNAHNLQIKGFFWGENSTIYAKTKVDNKYENLQFKYKDRLENIEKVAEFNKFVFVNGEDRHEFVTEYDFANFVHKELSEKDYSKDKFIMKGEIEFSEYNNKKYTNYNIQRIYVVKDEVEEVCEGNLEMYINCESLDVDQLEELGKMYLNGYVAQYDFKKGSEIGMNQVVEIEIPNDDPKKDKKIDRIKSNLECNDDDKLYKVGLKVELFNRNESVEFNEEMLTDEEKEDLELGFTTLDELKQQYGSGRGSFESKMIFKGWTRGYSSGAIETDKNLEELLTKSVKDDKKEKTDFEIDDDTDFDFEEALDNLGF